MAITCKELLNYDNFRDIFKPLNNSCDLENTITWFYIGTDIPSHATMPGGGELLFIPSSFIYSQYDFQTAYINTCLRLQVPGMVIVGSIENNSHITSILKYTEKAGFPVFCIENPKEIVGVTKKLACLIMQEESKSECTRSFIKTIMEDKPIFTDDILRKGALCGIDLNNPCFFVSFGCGYMGKSENEMADDLIKFRDNEEHILSQIEKICTDKQLKVLKYISEWQAVCLIELKKKNQFPSIREEIDVFLKAYRRDHCIPVVAGYSDVCSCADNIRFFYRQSERSVKLISSSRMAEISISFSEIGIMRFISYLSEKDKSDLIGYAMSEMGALIESDKNTGTEYMNTYRTFLYNDGKMQYAADKLFIHRNTLLKRLEQIEKILKKDIHNTMVKNEGINVFFVFDYFGIKF